LQTAKQITTVFAKINSTIQLHTQAASLLSNS